MESKYYKTVDLSVDEPKSTDLDIDKPQIIELDSGIAVQVRSTVIKYGTTEEWNSKKNLISERNVIYAYTDYQEVDGKKIPGLKLGDGKAYVVDLPFFNTSGGAALDTQITVNGRTESVQKLLTEMDSHMADSEIHVTAEEKEFWNNKISVTEKNGLLTLTKE